MNCLHLCSLSATGHDLTVQLYSAVLSSTKCWNREMGIILHALRLQGHIAFSNKKLENSPEGVGGYEQNK